VSELLKQQAEMAKAQAEQWKQIRALQETLAIREESLRSQFDAKMQSTSDPYKFNATILRIRADQDVGKAAVHCRGVDGTQSERCKR